MQTEKAERVTITLPPDMLAMITSKVQSGAYGSTSEVIREAMRFWEKQQEEHEARLALIRNRLNASVQSGEPVPLEHAFKTIERMPSKTLKTCMSISRIIADSLTGRGLTLKNFATSATNWQEPRSVDKNVTIS